MMIETFLKLPFSTAFSLFQMFSGRPRLKLLCGWSNHVNEDEVGTFIGFSIKIINPTSYPMHLERIEAVDVKGELFLPSVLELKPGREIAPRSNVIAVIPCDHILSTSPREITIIDGTETRHCLKGRKLTKAIVDLRAEAARLENLGFSIHPRITL